MRRAPSRRVLIVLLATALGALALPAAPWAGSGAAESGGSMAIGSGARPPGRSGPHQTPPPSSPSTTMVSSGPSGYGDGISLGGQITPDARFVTFTSSSTNLVSNDINNADDAFVKDTLTSAITAATPTGCSSDCGGDDPSISADGRWVAFDSLATFGLSGDANGTFDVFLKDMSVGTLTRISNAYSGGAANGTSQWAAVSGDGNWVVFSSQATNLVSGLTDTNNTWDVFLWNRLTQQITLVSALNGSTTVTGDAQSLTSSSSHELVSSNGRYVAFRSEASNLVSGDTNAAQDVFVRDTSTSGTTLMDLTTAGLESPTGASIPAMSTDGALVAFTSGSELVPGASCGTNCQQVYLRAGGQTSLVSSDSFGAPGNQQSPYIPSISANDAFVAFSSDATNLIGTGNDTNGITDVFVKSLTTGVTTRASVSSTGGQAYGSYSRYPSISSDGRYVSFEAKAGGLVSPDPVNQYQQYLRYNPTPSVPGGQNFGSCCGPDALSGVPSTLAANPPGFVGEPVNLATGSLYETSTDAMMPNIGVPFAFTRSYNSVDVTPLQGTPPSGGASIDQPIPISQGWTSAYNIYLRQYDWLGDLVLHTGDGQQILFVKQGDTFVSGAGVRDTLEKNPDQTFTVTRSDQAKYQFDTSGNITSMKDRNAQGLTFTYTSGHITSISGNAAWTVTPGYTMGRITSMTSIPLGRSVGYHYNAAGLLDQVTDIRGNLIKYTYTTAADTGQPLNLLKSVKDQNGNFPARNTYGANGRMVSQLDARGHTLSYAWNAQTQVATFTDARSKVWTYKYSDGTLVEVDDPIAGEATKYGYDFDLNASTVTDGRGNTTSSVYDASGNLTQENNDPSGLNYQKNWSYNANNDPLTFTDGRTPRRTTLFGYDGSGNLICQTLASASPAVDCASASASAKTTFGRDPSTGLMTSVTDPNGNATIYSYNNMGEPATVTSQLGYVTRLCYDAGGRMTSRVDPRGTELCGAATHPFTWTYGYDNADELTSAADPLVDSTSWTYGPAGNVTKRTDGNGHVTRWEYNAANDLTCVIAPTTTATTCATAPATSKTTYLYDYNDNLTGRTDSNSHSWTWDYDDANRLWHTNSPRAKQWTNVYWPNGLLKQRTLPSTATINYDYDPLNRLSSLTYSNAPTTPNVTMTWDANGNRLSMTDSNPPSTIYYVYDDANRMSSATRGTDVFSYQYYPAGQLKQVTYPDTFSVGYQYDADERLCSATTGAITTSCTSALSATTTFGYDPANDLIAKIFPSGNGYVSTMAYDNADRLTSVVNSRSGSTLSSYNFGSLDAVGNPASLTALSNGTTTTTYYCYDAMDRLKGATNLQNCTGSGLTGLGYTYDNVGNRLTQVRYGTPNVTTTSTYNADDQICWSFVGTSSNPCGTQPGGATTYTFSSNGNETQAGSTTYAYDLENRMATATVSGTTTSYMYDGNGNRTLATTSGTATNYLWDTNAAMADLAVERNGTGMTLRDYGYGDGLTSLTAGGSTYYYLPDTYENVANVTSGNGATEWTYSYEPFGTVTAAQNDPSAPTNSMQFDGQLLDPSSGLYDLRSRTYSVSQGQFVQSEPLAGIRNLPYGGSYVYTVDRPTVEADPSGACVEREGGGSGESKEDALAKACNDIRELIDNVGITTACGLPVPYLKPLSPFGKPALYCFERTVRFEVNGVPVFVTSGTAYILVIPGPPRDVEELRAWIRDFGIDKLREFGEAQICDSV